MRKAAAPPHFRHIGFDSRLLMHIMKSKARRILFSLWLILFWAGLSAASPRDTIFISEASLLKTKKYLSKSFGCNFDCSLFFLPRAECAACVIIRAQNKILHKAYFFFTILTARVYNAIVRIIFSLNRFDSAP